MTNISVSEINAYLKCHRAWDISSSSRQSLKHRITPKIYFVIGSAVHEAIDAQASGGDPLAAFEAYVEKERNERVAFYYEITKHSPDTSEMQEFEDSVELAWGLTNQYFNQYGWETPLEDLGLKYVATEIPFTIPLENGMNFCGTFDGIATDIATESLFYLVENKTAASKPNIDLVQFSNQFVGYNWAFRTLTGVKPSGTVYNLMLKRLIKKPKVLKKGGLSQDKNAGVTMQSFLTELQRGKHDPVDYLDYMTYLEDRERNGDDRFFLRDKFTYTNVQLDNWHDTVLEPISDELNTAPKIYPNKTSCDNCLVKDICVAMDLGDDVQAVIDARYEKKTYGTMELVTGATPEGVSSVEELLGVLNG